MSRFFIGLGGTVLITIVALTLTLAVSEWFILLLIPNLVFATWSAKWSAEKS